VLDRVFVDQGNLTYETAKDTFSLKALNLNAENIFYKLNKISNPLATLSTKCILKAAEIKTGVLAVQDVSYELDIDNGEFIIIPKKVSFFGEEGKGKFILKPFIEIPTYQLKYEVNQFQVEKLLTSFLEDTIITGKADLRLDISMKGDYWDSIVGNLNGQVYLKGNDLTLWGMDADKLVEELKRSQNFNLVDVGAVLLAGPVGLAVTKGSDYARIFISKPDEKTEITSFISNWEVVNGKMTMADVAFSTKNNRIAAQGWIDLKIDKIDMTIAALNKDGCSIMSQDLKGKLSDPKMGDVKVVKSIIAPVTNLVKGAAGVDCKVFYKGEVQHPVKQK
jgi:AsmA protein